MKYITQKELNDYPYSVIFGTYDANSEKLSVMMDNMSSLFENGVLTPVVYGILDTQDLPLGYEIRAQFGKKELVPQKTKNRYMYAFTYPDKTINESIEATKPDRVGRPTVGSMQKWVDYLDKMTLPVVVDDKQAVLNSILNRDDIIWLDEGRTRGCIVQSAFQLNFKVEAGHVYNTNIQMIDNEMGLKELNALTMALCQK